MRSRLVFQSIEIQDDRVIAVVPQPEFAPYFVINEINEDANEANENGADPSAPSSEVLKGRKRRAMVARLRYFPQHAVIIGELPEVPRVGRSRRAAYQFPRRHKLSADDRRRIQLAACSGSLRELAAEYGVSHETNRSILGTKARV